MTKRVIVPIEVAKVAAPKKPRPAKVVPDTSDIELLNRANIELEVWNSKLQQDLEFEAGRVRKLSAANTALFVCAVILAVSIMYFSCV